MLEKDKARKDEEKVGLYLAILNAALALMLLFGSLNPCGIIGSAGKSFYKMLFSFKPYSLEGISLGAVNALLIVAMIMILASVITYIAFGMMVFFGKKDIEKARFGYLAALACQLVSIVVIIIAKVVADKIEGKGEVGLGQGFLVYLIFALVASYSTLKYFGERIEKIRKGLVAGMNKVNPVYYTLVALGCAVVILIIAVIPAANPIRFSTFQNSEAWIASIFGGFADYVIELAQAVLPDGNTYSAFSFQYGGFSKSYELLSGWTFKVAYYFSIAFLIALAVTVIGLAISFAKKKIGNVISVVAGLVSTGLGLVLCIGAKCLTTHTKGYYDMFRTEKIKEVDYFPVKTPITMTVIMILLVIMLVAILIKSTSSLKDMGGSLANACGKYRSYISEIGIIACSAILVALAFIPGLNMLNISGKLPKQSLIATLGDFNGFKQVFAAGIEKRFYQSSNVNLLWLTGILILVAAIICIAGIIIGKALKKEKITNAVSGSGLILAALSIVLAFVSYSKINVYYAEMSTDPDIGNSMSAYYSFLDLKVPAGLICVTVVTAIVALFYGTLVKGTTSLMIARLSSVVLILAAFIPGVNPGRISSGVNKNKVLWGTALGYKSYIENLNSVSFQKAFADERAYILMYALALVLFLAVVALVVSFCLSFGELKFKRVSCKINIVASVTGVIVTALMPFACKLNELTLDLAKYVPMRPMGMYIYLLGMIICLVFSVAGLVKLPVAMVEDKYEVKQSYKLFLMSLPFIALVVVFSYLPLWGWRYAFYNYTPGTDLSFRDFVGWDWFKFLIERPSQRAEMVRVLRNTLVMSGLGLTTQVLPVLFAIFISEIRRPWFRKIVQTVTTIPNFISWVLVYAIARALFESDGFVNNFAINLGLYDNPKMFLQFSGFATCIWMLLFGIWKGLGWSAIVYIAAISGIDQQLYEAATVDGAGRFKRMWHITVPGLMPTFMVMFLMAIAGCLSNGMDQYYVFKTSSNKEWIEVLDYYVYRLGLGDGSVALATIIGMMKSIVSVVLLFIANGVSKLVRGESIV